MSAHVTQIFGALLRAGRLLVPYSVDELARAVRVRGAKVTAWEKGDMVPTVMELGAITRALRARPDRVVAAAALFRLAYDVDEVTRAAEILPAPLAPRRRLEGRQSQPPGSLPPIRHPVSGRFVSALLTVQGLVSDETPSQLPAFGAPVSAASAVGAS
jgi:transcriptional regulator with XRE-family HTH domain